MSSAPRTQLADECLKINDLILSTYADFGFTGELTVKLSTRPEKRVGTDEMWDHAERVMATVLRRSRRRATTTHQDRDQSGRRRVLRAEVRIRAARRHRPRLAVRHHAGRLQPAGAVRRVLHRRMTARKKPPGDGAPRDLRLDGALHRHPDRALCRQLPALARAGAGGRHHHHLGRRRIRQGGRWPPRGARAFASRSTCATRRSTTRSASIRWPRSRRCSWSARRKPRRIRSRSAGSAAKARR